MAHQPASHPVGIALPSMGHMPVRRPFAITLSAAFAALSVVHLAAQLGGAGRLATITQWLLMPTLAGALVLLTVGRRPRLVVLTLVALGFSWLGDTAPDLAGGDTAFLVMVGAFLLAQLAYVAAFWPDRRRSVLAVHRPLLTAYVLAIASLVWACAPHAGELLVPVLVYGLCLGLMAVLATGVNPIAGVGGALFLISDGLIALHAFAPGYDLAQHGFWVMLTYVVAQALLVVGVLVRVREPGGRRASAAAGSVP